MSLLAPLYFLGALAVGLPIVFHLIRRQPRGQIEFSSLMFLRPTPPRLTRRSRLDNWLLLLLRALALTLLAIAFSRPFFRSATSLDTELPGRKIVLVVDTSASMQRVGLWQQVLDKAAEVLSDLQPADSLALVTFDSEPTLLVGFDEASRLTAEQVKSASENALRDAKPSWRHTDLGRAISFAGDLAVNFEPGRDSNSEQPNNQDGTETVAANTAGPSQVILITDMQSGSQIESLQAYAWPKDLKLDVRKVAPAKRTNASARVLAPSPAEGESPDRVRVRVSNASDSESSKFNLAWAAVATAAFVSPSEGMPAETNDKEKNNEDENNDDENDEAMVALPVQVPPGQSRVVRMPLPPPGVESLVLRGDDHGFDNARYIVSPEPSELNLAFIGPDPSEPRESLLYYLQRVPFSNQRRAVTIRPADPTILASDDLNSGQTPLIVLSQALNEQAIQSLRNYIESGGRVLAVLADDVRSEAMVDTINALARTQLNVSEAAVDDYAMLSRINFRHPIFEPMADPQFNDFSKIRFWNHRKLENIEDAWRRVADFDDGDPALIETLIGKGRLWVLASGWQPQAGQLALSTKFIPLMYSLFDLGSGRDRSDQYVLGESIEYQPSSTASITGPAGTEFAFRSADDLDGIDQPGIYVFEDGETRRAFAVNLNESESRTEPIDEDELERFGVILGDTVTSEQAREARRQLRDRELESQQKFWKWFLAAALAILGLETVLGGWRSRKSNAELVATNTVP